MDDDDKECDTNSDDHKESEPVIKQYTEKINDKFDKLTETEREQNAIERLQQQFNLFAPEIKKIKTKSTRLQSAVTQLKAKNEQYATNQNTIAMENQSFANEIASLKSKHTTSTTQLQKAGVDKLNAETKLTQGKKRIKEQDERIQTLDDDMKQKEQTVKRLSDELQSAKTNTNQQIHELQEKEHEIEALRSELESITSFKSSQTISKLQKEKDLLEDEMVEQFTLHKQQIQSLQQQINQLAHQRKQTQDKHVNDIHVRDEEIRRLVAESKTKPEDANTFQEQLQSAQRETQRLEAENKQYLEEKKALQTAIESLQSTLKSESATHATQLQNVSDAQLHTQIEFAQAKQYINSQDQDIQTLKKYSQNMQIMQMSFDEKKTQCAQMKQHMKLVHQKVQTLNDQLLSAQAQAKQWKEASKQQNQDEARRFKGHQDKYHKHMAVCKENKERLQYEIQQKCDEIDSLKAERETITTQLREKENEYKKVLEEQKQSKALYLKETQCSRRLQSSYIALQKECDQMKILHEEQRSVIKKEKEDAIAQIQSWQQLEEERKQTHDQRNKEIHAKEEELSRRLEAKQRELEQKGKEHQVLLEAKQAEYTQKQEQLQSSQRETLQLGAENEQYRAKENEYAMLLEQATDNQLNAQKELEEVNTKYNELKNTLQQLDKDQEALMTKHREYQQRIGGLEHQLKSESSAHSIKHNEYNALEQRCESERWAHSMKSNALDALDAKHNALAAKYNDLMNIILIYDENRLKVTKKELDELATRIQLAFAAQVNGLSTSKIDILLQQQKNVLAQHEIECELSKGLKRTLRQHQIEHSNQDSTDYKEDQ
eukprot:33344_1